MNFGIQMQIWNSVTKYENFKIQHGVRLHFKNVFGHNSAPNCPISVKLLCDEGVFNRISVTEQIARSTV